jgi:FtsP/CotA-like multicopper oxidase with cupredoxin domain
MGFLVVLTGLPYHALAQHTMAMAASEPMPARAHTPTPGRMPAHAPTPVHESFRSVKMVNGRQIIVYQLYITDTMVNYTGRQRHAIAVNGQLPGPTLEFTEGDTAEVHIHNEMMMETSVHWHGLIVPNQYDGVSYLSAPPIRPMETYVARFPIVQNGTYWYHSHTMLQEQIGLYGALIIHKREASGAPDAAAGKEEVLLLSDWTDENPHQVQRSLHYATDWYAIRKGSTQDYAAAIRAHRFHTKLANEWKRMLPMDVSDVYYNRFLVNGLPEEHRTSYRTGESVRLRIINGSSSTYFWLQYAGGPITVIASDGKDVVPVEVGRLIVGVSETYDVIVTIPDNGSYAFRASAEDRTGSATLWLGGGDREQGGKLQPDTSKPHALTPLAPLRYFEGMDMMNGMMKGNGEMKPMAMQMSNQTMDMNSIMYPDDEGKALNYGMLRSPTKSTLPEAPMRVLHFNLTGNMNRYVWTIDNKAVSETDRIVIRHGENVRIILHNGTMMRHPMHLHGHFFRLLNGQGDYAPLKEVVDILPMETDTLEFAASESGDWFFHCHILYHMMSGMGRIFHYEGSPPNPGLPDSAAALKQVYSDDREIRPMARVGIESNGSDGEAMLSNTRYRFQTEWRLGTDARRGYESESHLGRYLGTMQYWLPYVGWDFRYRRASEQEKNLFGQMDTKDHRNVFCAGLQYTLPLLLVADWRIDTRGNLRLQLGREDVAVTSRLRFSFMVNTDKEYMAGFRYIVTKYFGFSTHYDSDMGFGAGVTFNY